jgi:hypothetical protein
MLTTVIALGSIVITSVLWTSITRRIERQRRNRLLADREKLTPEAIYTCFYATRGLPHEEFLAAWATVALLLRVDSAQLRPDDSLDSLDTNVIGPIDDFYFLNEHLASQDMAWSAIRHLHTIDDVVSALVRCSEGQKRHQAPRTS